jgi:hypothetical protein
LNTLSSLVALAVVLVALEDLVVEVLVDIELELLL